MMPNPFAIEKPGSGWQPPETSYFPRLDSRENALVNRAYEVIDSTTARLNLRDLEKPQLVPSADRLYACFPDVISDCLKKYPNSSPENDDQAVQHLSKVLTGFARVCQLLRIRFAHAKDGDSRQLDVTTFQTWALESPDIFFDKKLVIEETDTALQLVSKEPVVIDEQTFARQETVTEGLGKHTIWIGSGGGSDCIQATQLALETPGALGVISIRSNILGSEADKAQKRTVENAQEVFPGVFLISPESSGSGRFLENTAALTPGSKADGHRLPTILIVVDDPEKLPEQIRHAVSWVESEAITAGITDADSLSKDKPTIMNVDTGGDCWRVPYEAEAEQKAVATAEQDFMMLKCLASMSEFICRSVTVANGIDSPDDVVELMHQAGAKYFSPDAGMAAEILKRYAEWNLTGEDPKRYGKTAFAWQVAQKMFLAEMNGEVKSDTVDQARYVAVPLPPSAVDHPRNPWDPFVYMQPSMQGVFIADLQEHYQALMRHSARQ